MGTISQMSYNLRWNLYESTVAKVFDRLLTSQTFVDVTLVSETTTMKAHKLILCAVSPYFQTILTNNPCEHPVIIIHDIDTDVFHNLVKFIYKGEVSVTYDRLSELKKWATKLQIEGLIAACQTMIDVLRNAADVPASEMATVAMEGEESNNEDCGGMPVIKKKNKRRNRRTGVGTNCSLASDNLSAAVQSAPADVSNASFSDRLQIKVESCSSDREEMTVEHEEIGVTVNNSRVDHSHAVDSNEQYVYIQESSGEQQPMLSWPGNIDGADKSKCSDVVIPPNLGFGNYSGGSERFGCDICQKTFKTRYILMLHRASHNPNRPLYVCSLCQRKYHRTVELKRHHKKKHPNEPIDYTVQ